jgi:3-hydroxyacyl-CoA dehydrogenase
MHKPFQTAAVLGAGVMGTQIAAHLANAGLTVYLLDLPAKSGDKNGLVEGAIKKAMKQSPPIFFTEKMSRRVIPGNYDDHFDRLADVDWVIEAVIENLDIKKQLMQRLEATIRSDTVVSSNTSGLPIAAIAEGRSDSFRQRFLGTHFFNPPRYLKLLELIPTTDTDPAILEQMRWFGELHLGKGIVIAKDTPNFIANRIGMFATILAMKAWTEQGYTIEEIDTLTGTIVGRPKSATFRTADMVGLDTIMYVASNLYPAIPKDEQREVFRIPKVLQKMVQTGTLGAKSGQGFYKKQDKQILSLNPETMGYAAPQPVNLGDIDRIAKIPDLGDRLRALYADSGRAGKFFRPYILALLNYSAQRIPEVADCVTEIDHAMQWGFGWEWGPFQIWDALGMETILTDMQAAGVSIPAWIDKMQQMCARSFYHNHHVYKPELHYTPLSTSADEIDLETIKETPQNTLWENSEAALLDMGDGVVLYEFRSKGNTLSLNVVNGLAEVLDLLEQRDFKGMVIGNTSAHFSGGANLAEMGMMAQTGKLDAIAQLIVQFQSLMQRIHYFPKPIVAAVQGRVLGGGCELVMACPHVVAAAETYIGLVEVGVGLIPGAGGIMRMVARATERAASETPGHIQPFLRNAFETIATAKVSGSAYEAQELGYLPCDAEIVMDGDRRLSIAKSEVLHLDYTGYTPPPKQNSIMVLGRPGRAMLDHAAYIFQQSGYASEYDRYLAGRLAYVMTGGELTAPALVSEDYLLQLERENFIPLLSQPKTHERIGHMLKTKKPLRN